MSIEDQKLDQISRKISELIALKNQKETEIESLLEENKSLREENDVIKNSQTLLEKEVEKLKTFDKNSLSNTNGLDEEKINGMIKEIEECLTLLKS